MDWTATYPDILKVCKNRTMYPPWAISSISLKLNMLSICGEAHISCSFVLNHPESLRKRCQVVFGFISHVQTYTVVITSVGGLHKLKEKNVIFVCFILLSLQRHTAVSRVILKTCTTLWNFKRLFHYPPGCLKLCCALFLFLSIQYISPSLSCLLSFSFTH